MCRTEILAWTVSDESQKLPLNSGSNHTRQQHLFTKFRIYHLFLQYHKFSLRGLYQRKSSSQEKECSVFLLFVSSLTTCSTDEFHCPPPLQLAKSWFPSHLTSHTSPPILHFWSCQQCCSYDSFRMEEGLWVEYGSVWPIHAAGARKEKKNSKF